MPCLVTSTISKDEGFQELRKYYSKWDFTDDHLAQVLQMFKETHPKYSDDWYPKTSAEYGAFTRYLRYRATKDKTKRTTSKMEAEELFNLYTKLNSIYTPEQLDNRINMIFHRFLDVVDALVDANGGKYSRQELINAQSTETESGVQKILSYVFSTYEQYYNDTESRLKEWEAANPGASEGEKAKLIATLEYQRKEMALMLENKGRLAALAATRIGEVEGFSVSSRGFEISLSNPEDAIENSDADGATQEDGDAEEHNKEERYADYRTTKLVDTLSTRARRFVSRIVKTDNNGNPIVDDMGMEQYLDMRQAAAVLNGALVNSSPESLISDLNAAADFHPWIHDIVRMIEQNPDYHALVYNNFKKSETTYVNTLYEGGRYASHIANSRSAGNALMREAGTNLSRGLELTKDTMIVNGDGSLKSPEEIAEIAKGLEDIRTMLQTGDDSVKDINMVDGGGVDTDAMKAYLDSHPNLTKQLASYLRGIGFNVTANDVRTVALQTLTPKGYSFIAPYSLRNKRYGRNKLYHLVNYISAIYSAAQKQNNGVKTGRYLYNTMGKTFRYINSIMALSKYKDIENRVVSNGKSLSSHNNRNLIHDVFDLISNKANRSDEDYKAMLENEFIRFEGMSLGFGENRKAHGWLRRLYENKDQIRDYIEVVDHSGFKNRDYDSLTRAEKLTNSLVMYLIGGELYKNSQFSGYEVPIQGDYSTAYQFVIAPRLSEEEVIDELTNEVLIELEVRAAIEEREKNEDRAVLDVYEKQGKRFQIFPGMNDTDVVERFISAATPEEAINIIREAVKEQIEEIIKVDLDTIDKSGILSDESISKVADGSYASLYSKDGRVASLDEKGISILRRYAMNTFYAREQITKLITGGLHQFKGTIDYEKRNMLSHATRSAIDTRATWKGKPLEGRTDTQNVMYVSDDESKSAFIDDISEMLLVLKDEGLITAGQFKYMIREYGSITTTDGQGLRTLESYRKIKIMLNQWDDRHELAYSRIVAGKPKKSDIQLFMQNIKPVLTGYEEIEASEGEMQKPIRLTVLHKYSEMVLLPLALAEHCLQANSVPFKGLAAANEVLKKQGKDVDMFLFHSGVKVGSHSRVSPFAKDDNDNRILNTEEQIRDYVVSSVLSNPHTIHSLPLKYYGIASATPEHAANERIAWVAQAEKQEWANIQEGESVIVRGKRVDAKKARDEYHKIKAADIIIEADKLRRMFTDTDELERVFREELATKSYSGSDIQYALAHLKDGSFGIPLYSPNVEHQIQQLLTSIVRKRLTKPKKKGVALLQTTSLGVDAELSTNQFDETDSILNKDKLKIVFEGTGSTKRVKYVEVTIPIHDSRLLKYADKDGNISRQRLDELIAAGIVPESMLEFIAFRTPSDAEHSIIPCRIVAFTPNVEGATIRMPKEVMKMTGHDYDGDKIRCYFKQFHEENIPLVAQTDEFKSRLVTEEYDYSKNPFENTQEARDNARVELMFAKATSPFGSRMMLIPGGCEELSVLAKTLYILRNVNTDALKDKVARVLIEQKAEPSSAYRAVNNPNTLYGILIKKSDHDISDIVSVIAGATSPFSVTHAADAFDSIMGGASMIGPYAVYSSAFQMLQRINVNYIPLKTEKGGSYDVEISGKKFGRFFNIKNDKGLFGSFTMGHLVNAAVDNNKNPILGYLNQNHNNAEMTFFLAAAGVDEETIHLLMNQPAVVELYSRLSTGAGLDFATELRLLLDELSGGSDKLGKITTRQSLKKVAEFKKNSLVEYVPLTYEQLQTGTDFSALEDQIYILKTLGHLNGTASLLGEFVRATRPEADSRAMGTSVASAILKSYELKALREKLMGDDIRLSGLKEVLAEREIYDGIDGNAALEKLGAELPEVVALNTFMMDNGPEMFANYFPLANEPWYEFANMVMDKYSVKEYEKEKLLGSIGNEMILWKLLSDSRFVNGNPQEEQRRILVDVPKQLADIANEIAKAETDENASKWIKALVGNAFLDKLTVSYPEDAKGLPRIQFTMNGAAIEGQRDLIMNSWNALLFSDDERIHNLAIDLFKYCLYTNGFSYGMYEFFHFAPFSVLYSTSGYMDALRDVIKEGRMWRLDEFGNPDTESGTEFLHYYYMNHWADNRLVPQIHQSNVKFDPDNDGNLFVTNASGDSVLRFLSQRRYVVLVSNLENKRTDLYRIDRGDDKYPLVLRPVPKLGLRNRNQQVTLQYNPDVNHTQAYAVAVGDDSAWGSFTPTDPYAVGNINAEGEHYDSSAYNFSGFSLQNSSAAGQAFLASLGITQKTKDMQTLETKATEADAKNEALFAKANRQLDSDLGNNGNLSKPLGYARYADSNGYEVSSGGDNRFSARYAKFKEGTVLFGHNVGGRTIESVYQNGVKQGDWTTDSNNKTGRPRSKAIITGSTEDDSYMQGYLPLWEEWAKQNPELIDELRKLSSGKTLTDKFATTKVYQARALYDILTTPISDMEENPEIGGTGNAELDNAISGSFMSQLMGGGGGQLLQIAQYDNEGSIVVNGVPITPGSVAEARLQREYVRLNNRLREILRKAGVSIGTITEAEARLALNGVTDFKTAHVLCEGMKELIRLAEGKEGEYALPEEFAHVALAMLGRDDVLVSRLYDALRSNTDAMEEAFDGQYEEYKKRYSEKYKDDYEERLVIEAAGKLVSKNLLLHKEISTSPIRRLVYRIVEKIKSVLRKFRKEDIDDALFEANDIASKLAKDLLSGRLADQMKFENIRETGEFHSIQADLTDKDDILNRLLKSEVKRLSILKRRVANLKKGESTERVLKATEVQIDKLKSAILNYKSESAIVNYLHDSLEYLAEVEKSLDEAVNSGRPANAICRKLNVVRDTLYSFASAMEAISDAIVSDEIKDTADLTAALDAIAGVLSRFNNKYQRLGKLYFENMLRDVYGEGVEITVGKYKGRKITVHEMATKADKDISFMSRWFEAIGDSPDYVLGAFDDIVRSAKIRARNRANAIRPKVETAIEKLRKETGSRDQKFMFEWKLGEDGKYHKTGFYISEEESKKLSPARKEFYDTMMSIKNEMDTYVPESLVKPNRIVTLRKEFEERLREAGVKDKAKGVWSNIKNAILDTSDIIDYENKEVVVDFEGNRVDMLAVRFLNKGKDESYDDMTDDVATSIMAYAGMATEYNEMNGIIGILENAKYMSSERDVLQKTGNKTQRESIGFDKQGRIDEDMPAYYRKPFTVKQARTHIQEAIEDFFAMHVYGHIRKDEGTFGNTRISKRKVADWLGRRTTVAQMALNIPQRLSNVFTGDFNKFVEILAVKNGKRLFSYKDLWWANGIYVKETADRITDIGKTESDNKLSLFCEHFDVHQDNDIYASSSAPKYRKGRISRVVNSGLLYMGLRAGEDYLAVSTALALARNNKVKDASGKVTTLWDAYEVKYTDQANKTGAYLSLKSGYTQLDGSPITSEYEQRFQKLVIDTNFSLQGIYNTDDKSAIQQHWLGALFIMYRKWIAPALRRRYGGTRYNTRINEFHEGYYRTLFRFIHDSMKDTKDSVSEENSHGVIANIIRSAVRLKDVASINWNKMTPYEKSNIVRASGEFGISIGLIIACAIFTTLPPKDDESDENRFLSWTQQTLLYYLLRLRSEVGSITPTHMMVNEALRVVKSPFAAMRTLQSLTNGLRMLLPWNWFIDVKGGRYRGHSKSFKYFMELPTVAMVRKIQNFIDPTSLINYYKNDVAL